MLLEWLKIPVSMQQRVTTQNAKARDKNIYRLANGDASPPQGPVVRYAAFGDCSTKHLFICEGSHQTPRPPIVRLDVEPSQYFRENDVAGQEQLASKQIVEKIGFSARRSVEVVNPDGAVDQHHREVDLTPPSGVEIASPTQLSSVASYAFLFLEADKHLKAFMNDLTFGFEGRKPFGATHQAFIDVDIRSHSRLGCV